MPASSLQAKANTGAGTDQLAGINTGAGFVGAVMLTNASGADITSGNPLPVVNASPSTPITASGSLTAVNQAVTLTLNGQGNATFQLSGTFVGSVTFEASNNGTDWTTIYAYKAGDNVIAQTVTTPDVYRCTVSGLAQVRARCSAYTSGTIVVDARAVEAVSGTFLNFPLPPGPSAIGTVGNTEVATTGTIVSAVGTVQATVDQGSAVTIQLSGTHAGLNVTFEISNDGTNWDLVFATRSGTTAPVTATGALTANSTTIWQSYCGGAQFYRVRATAYTSGTLNVAIRSLGIGAPVSTVIQPSGTQTVTVGTALPAGTNTIGRVNPTVQSTWTNRSGTITTGGASQQLMAANASRNGFFVQNVSTGDLWIMDGATATVAQPSIRLSPGQLYESPVHSVPTTVINVIGATTGQAFSSREW